MFLFLSVFCDNCQNLHMFCFVLYKDKNPEYNIHIFLQVFICFFQNQQLHEYCLCKHLNVQRVLILVDFCKYLQYQNPVFRWKKTCYGFEVLYDGSLQCTKFYEKCWIFFFYNFFFIYLYVGYWLFWYVFCMCLVAVSFVYFSL